VVLDCERETAGKITILHRFLTFEGGELTLDVDVATISVNGRGFAFLDATNFSLVESTENGSNLYNSDTLFCAFGTLDKLFEFEDLLIKSLSTFERVMKASVNECREGIPFSRLITTEFAYPLHI